MSLIHLEVHSALIDLSAWPYRPATFGPTLDRYALARLRVKHWAKLQLVTWWIPRLPESCLLYVVI